MVLPPGVSAKAGSSLLQNALSAKNQTEGGSKRPSENKYKSEIGRKQRKVALEERLFNFSIALSYVRTCISRYRCTGPSYMGRHKCVIRC